VASNKTRGIAWSKNQREASQDWRKLAALTAPTATAASTAITACEYNICNSNISSSAELLHKLKHQPLQKQQCAGIDVAAVTGASTTITTT
jgi:hypothetical protein